jgi:F-type H+-transporting ATPase subunit epsilon
VKFSLTTPRGALVETDVDEVTAPGEAGEFGVLPGHVALMAGLRPGVLSFKSKDHTTIVAVGEGFLQVSPQATAEPGRDRVIVLVDRAVRAGEVDRAAAERDAAAADKELAAWKAELDGAYHALVVRRQWAQARIDAAARVAAH